MIVVLIHGYPEPISKNQPLYDYFASKEYSIISLSLLSSEFKLTQEGIMQYVKEKLEGREPDVIVGVSLGGLAAPFLAKDFPKVRLVLIATGPYIRTKIKTLNKLLTIGEASVLFSPVHWIIVRAPVWLYSLFYKLFSRPIIDPEEKRALEEHIKQNWQYLKNVSLSENKEVINFLASTDNSILLRSLKNKTLIFSGSDDNLLSYKLSLELKNLIKKSVLITTDNRMHFDIFAEAHFKVLDDFLGDS